MLVTFRFERLNILSKHYWKLLLFALRSTEIFLRPINILHLLKQYLHVEKKTKKIYVYYF